MPSKPAAMRLVASNGGAGKRRFSTTAITVVAMFALTLPVRAGTDHAQRASLDPLGISDADYYAAEFGTTVEEAQRRFALMDGAESEMELLAVLAGKRLAGIWFAHTPSFRIVLSLVGAGSIPAIDEVAAESRAPVDIKFGALASLEDLESDFKQLEPIVQSIPGASSRVDVMTNSVVIETPSVERAQELVAASGLSPRVERGRTLEAQVLYGGRRLTFDIPGYCTTGFTTRNPTNVGGIVTAGHCPNTGIRYQQQGDLVFSMQVSGEFRDGDEDWQFIKPSSGTQTASPRFWDGAQWVTVTNPLPPSDSAMVGNWVCHGGYTTGKSCGTIQTVWYDPGDLCGPNSSGPCNGTWIEVKGNNLACYAGDSGGPWYHNSRAYGTHSFGSSTGTGQGQCSKAVFMSAYYIDARGYSIVSG